MSKPQSRIPVSAGSSGCTKPGEGGKPGIQAPGSQCLDRTEAPGSVRNVSSPDRGGHKEGTTSKDTPEYRSRPSCSPGRSGQQQEVSRASVGERVCVAGLHTGTLRYFGRTAFQDGLWCGVEFASPVGKNDGSVDGVRYFQCKEKHGIFAPVSRVELSPLKRAEEEVGKVVTSGKEVGVCSPKRLRSGIPQPSFSGGWAGESADPNRKANSRVAKSKLEAPKSRMSDAHSRVADRSFSVKRDEEARRRNFTVNQTFTINDRPGGSMNDTVVLSSTSTVDVTWELVDRKHEAGQSRAQLNLTFDKDGGGRRGADIPDVVPAIEFDRRSEDTGQVAVSKQNSFELDESLGILTPDQMREFTVGADSMTSSYSAVMGVERTPSFEDFGQLEDEVADEEPSTHSTRSTTESSHTPTQSQYGTSFVVDGPLQSTDSLKQGPVGTSTPQEEVSWKNELCITEEAMPADSANKSHFHIDVVTRIKEDEELKNLVKNLSPIMRDIENEITDSEGGGTEKPLEEDAASAMTAAPLEDNQRVHSTVGPFCDSAEELFSVPDPAEKEKHVETESDMTKLVSQELSDDQSAALGRPNTRSGRGMEDPEAPGGGVERQEKPQHTAGPHLQKAGYSDGEDVGAPRPAEVGTSDGVVASVPHPAEVGATDGEDAGAPHPAEVGATDGEDAGAPHPAEVGTTDGEHHAEIPQFASVDTGKSRPTSVWTETSFITSVTSIASIDTGYQGDGEDDVKSDGGTAANSPTEDRSFAVPTGVVAIDVNKIKFDVMTDSDFCSDTGVTLGTESDLEHGPEQDEGMPSRDRSARVIDGTLYSSQRADLGSSDFPSANQPTSQEPQSEMESSGFFSDVERKAETKTVCAEDKRLSDTDAAQMVTENNDVTVIFVKTISENDVSLKELSPDDTFTITDSEIHQRETCLKNSLSVLDVTLTEQDLKQSQEMNVLLTTSEKGHEDEKGKTSRKEKGSQLSAENRVCPQRNRSRSGDSRRAANSRKDFTKEDISKKPKMPKKNVMSKIKAMIESSSCKTAGEDGDSHINEDQENKKPARAPKKSRWDAVMNKIAQGQEEEKKKPKVKEVKSKVFANFQPPPLPTQRRADASLTPKSSPRTGVSGKGPAGSSRRESAAARNRSSKPGKRPGGEAPSSEPVVNDVSAHSSHSSPHSSHSDLSASQSQNVSKASTRSSPSNVAPLRKKVNRSSSQLSIGSSASAHSQESAVSHTSRVSRLSRVSARHHASTAAVSTTAHKNKPTTSSNATPKTQQRPGRRTNATSSPSKASNNQRLPAANRKPAPLRDQNRLQPHLKPSTGLVKPSRQTDVINKVSSTTQAELSRLEALCETRTKELNQIKMQLKYNSKGFDAMAAVIKYLTGELDAFSVPRLSGQLGQVQAELVQAKLDLDEAVASHRRLEDELNGQKERSKVRLEQVTDELESQLQQLRQEHEHEMNTLRANHKDVMNGYEEQHRLQVDELKKENELSVKDVTAEHEKRLRDVEAEHALLSEAEQQKHRNEIRRLKKSFTEDEEELKNKLDERNKECQILQQHSQRLVESLMKDTDVKIQVAASRASDLQKEVDSLKTVVDMRNKDIRELRQENIEMQKQVEELHICKEKIQKLEAKAEDLQAQRDKKVETERRLCTDYYTLEESYKKQDQMNKRLSMEKEQLQWRLRQNLESPCVPPAVCSDQGSSLDTGNSTKSGHSPSRSPTVPHRARLSTIEHSSSDGSPSPGSVSLFPLLQGSSCSPRGAQKICTRKPGSQSPTKTELTHHLTCLSVSEEDSSDSPPSSPQIKAVIEKSDSVSWVLDLKDEVSSTAKTPSPILSRTPSSPLMTGAETSPTITGTLSPEPMCYETKVTSVADYKSPLVQASASRAIVQSKVKCFENMINHDEDCAKSLQSENSSARTSPSDCQVENNNQACVDLHSGDSDVIFIETETRIQQDKHLTLPEASTKDIVLHVGTSQMVPTAATSGHPSGAEVVAGETVSNDLQRREGVDLAVTEVKEVGGDMDIKKERSIQSSAEVAAGETVSIDLQRREGLDLAVTEEKEAGSDMDIKKERCTQSGAEEKESGLNVQGHNTEVALKYRVVAEDETEQMPGNHYNNVDSETLSGSRLSLEINNNAVSETLIGTKMRSASKETSNTDSSSASVHLASGNESGKVVEKYPSESLDPSVASFLSDCESESRTEFYNKLFERIELPTKFKNTTVEVNETGLCKEESDLDSTVVSCLVNGRNCMTKQCFVGNTEFPTLSDSKLQSKIFINVRDDIMHSRSVSDCSSSVLEAVEVLTVSESEDSSSTSSNGDFKDRDLSSLQENGSNMDDISNSMSISATSGMLPSNDEKSSSAYEEISCNGISVSSFIPQNTEQQEVEPVITGPKEGAGESMVTEEILETLPIGETDSDGSSSDSSGFIQGNESVINQARKKNTKSDRGDNKEKEINGLSSLSQVHTPPSLDSFSQGINPADSTAIDLSWSEEIDLMPSESDG